MVYRREIRNGCRKWFVKSARKPDRRLPLHQNYGVPGVRMVTAGLFTDRVCLKCCLAVPWYSNNRLPDRTAESCGCCASLRTAHMVKVLSQGEEEQLPPGEEAARG